VAPQVVVFAFPIGVWFGIISWRTGSIWPTIAGHAFINGMWNIFNLSQKFDAIPEVSTPVTLVGMAILGLSCFVPSCWILWKTTTLQRL
jgi:membrane protease YdiL (CAAX protease family)